jgi:drug/metabolite transporter (DMT)-like permease
LADELPPPPPSVHLALIAVQVMFASLSIAGKVVLRELAPFGMVAFRAPAAATILLIGFLFRPERVALRDLPALASYAFFGITANQLLFIAGLERSTATNAVVIGSITPVFTVGVAVLLRREAATVAKLVGLLVAFGGALAIVGLDRFQASRLTGNLLIVGNSLSFAIYLVISRTLLAKYRTLTVITWTLVIGALGILPFGARALVTTAPLLSRTTWTALGYIVIFPTVSTYFLTSFALKRAPSSLVAIYIYVQPVIGALMAMVVLGERPSAAVAVGGALIGTGIWLVTRDARRARV